MPLSASTLSYASKAKANYKLLAFLTLMGELRGMVKVLLPVFLVWAGGSYLTYRLVGTDGILPYAGITMAAVALAIWLANRRK